MSSMRQLLACGSARTESREKTHVLRDFRPTRSNAGVDLIDARA